jgi:nicotinamide-nucleotide amidase
VVGRELIRRGLRIALAESCTGGGLATMLTDVPGISSVFREGHVTYADEAKIRMLGVPAEELARHGAVSAEVARSMARGVASRAGVPVGVGITGIAGPDGGTEEKPVGTVYLAIHHDGVTNVIRCRFHGDRAHVRRMACLTALDRLRRVLLGEEIDTPQRDAQPFDTEIGEC